MEEQQDGGDSAEDDSGPLAGAFGTSQDFLVEDSIIFPTLGPGLHVLAHPSRHRYALLALYLSVVSIGPSDGLVIAALLCMEPGVWTISTTPVLPLPRSRASS